MVRIDTDKPIRVGIFSDLHAADRAVESLLAAGFSKEMITVICSDKAVQRHFEEFHHQDEAGHHTPANAAVGGTIGAVLGGLTAAALAAGTGGVALLVAGGAALGTGTVLGSLVGAMMSRGVEKEAANYYDQAVLEGKILVAVATPDDRNTESLDRAGDILSRIGAEPLQVPEG